MNSADSAIELAFERLSDFRLEGELMRQNDIVYDPVTQTYEAELIPIPVVMIFASNRQRGALLQVSEPSFQRIYVRSTETIRTSDYVLTASRERWNISNVIRYPSVNISILDVSLVQLEDVDVLSTRLINSGNISIEDDNISIADEREIQGITVGS